MSAFYFISLVFFIDLSSSTMERVALEVATRRVFNKKIADTLLFFYLSVNVLAKFHGKPYVDSIYPSA